MAYTKHLYHIVFGTKNRQPLINDHIAPRLHSYIAGIMRNIGSVPVLINGVADHVHILAYIPPTMAISDFVRIVKANSSRWLNQLPKYKIKFQWASRYGSFTVSEQNKEIVKNYIANQKQHHKKTTWEEEFKEFLQQNNIDFEEKYLWE